MTIYNIENAQYFLTTTVQYVIFKEDNQKLAAPTSFVLILLLTSTVEHDLIQYRVWNTSGTMLMDFNTNAIKEWTYRNERTFCTLVFFSAYLVSGEEKFDAFE